MNVVYPRFSVGYLFATFAMLLVAMGGCGDSEVTTGSTQKVSVTITDGPPDRTNATEAEFAFECDLDNGCGFDCKLDDGDWSSCETPTTYENLADGEHHFEVRATTSYTTSAPEDWSWVIDTEKPDVEIVDGPESITSKTTAEFDLSCSLDQCQYECSINGQERQECESGVTYDELDDGDHVFEVQAVDELGNVSAPATWEWTIDTVNPVVEDLSGPDDPTNETGATFDFSCSQSDCSFSCKLNDGSYEDCEPGVNYTGLDDGEHTFAVYATDLAGNEGSEANYDWTVDTVEPVIEYLDGPEDPTNDTSASFDFECSKDDCSFSCELNGDGFEDCDSGISYDSLGDGDHAFRVYATDSVGNEGSEVTYSWTVDTVEPMVENLDGPDDLTNETTATFDFECSKSDCSFSCDLNGDGFEDCDSGISYPETAASLNDGTHTFTVYATDPAGNLGPQVTHSWTVDTVEPVVQNLDGPDDPTNQTSATFDFNCSKSDCSFSCDLNGGGFQDCTPGTSYGGFSDGEHTFSVVASDPAGNTSAEESYQWTVDTVDPIVEGLTGPDDPSTETSASFDFTCSKDDCSFFCDLDGNGFEACNSGQSYSDLDGGDHTFTVYATDAAGNTGGDETYSWAIHTEAQLSSLSNQDTFNRSGGGWTGEGSGVSISDERGHLAVWEGYSTTIRIIDLETRSSVGTYNLSGGDSGKGLDYSPDGSLLFGVDNDGNWLARVDTADYTTTDTVNPPGGSGSDVRVISSDRLIVGMSDRVLLYDHDLTLLDSVHTDYAGFLSYDEHDDKIYASGVGYHADEGIARISLNGDTLSLDWQEATGEPISGIFPLDTVFVQVAESGEISIRAKSDRQVLKTENLGQAYRTPAAQLSYDSVVIVDTSNGDIVQYTESHDEFTWHEVANSGTSNGTAITENYFSVYWNSATNGVELWDVDVVFD